MRLTIPPGTRARAHGTALVLTIAMGCASDTPGRQAETATDLVPPNASFVVVVDDLDTLATRIDVTTLRERHGTLLARAGTALKNAVGFDLLDPDSARAGGLDTGSPLAMAVLSEPRGATLLVLPGDRDRITARLDGVYRRRGATPRLMETHHGVAIHVADRAQAAFFGLADHVLVVSGVSRADTRLELCRALVDGAGTDAISSAAAFRGASARLPEGAHLLAYFAPVEAAGDTATATTPALTLGESLAPFLSFTHARGPHRGAAIAARVATDRLTLTSFAALEDPAGTLGASPRAARTRDGFLERLSSEPLIALQVNLEPSAVLDRLESLGVPGMRADATTAGPGVAPPPDGRRTRILKALTGRAGILATRVGVIGTDMVGYAQGTSADAVAALLDSAVVRLREHPLPIPMLGTTRGIQADAVRNVSFYRLPLAPFAELCAGVVDDHLVITTTRARMVSIIEGTSSFLEHVPDPGVRRALTEGPMTAAYVDIEGVAKALGALPIPQAEAARGMVEAIEMFEHLTVIADVDDDGYETRVEVVGAPGVWPRVVEALLAARGRES